MKTYNEMMEETERKTKNSNEVISSQIIMELERIYHIHFPVKENHLTYGMLIQMLLFDSTYQVYRFKLLDLLEKYNVNENNIITRFLTVINQESLLYSFKCMIEKSFCSLPYCKKLEKVDNGYIIEAQYGVVYAYQLSKFIDNAIFYSLLQKNIFQGNCHWAVEVCSQYNLIPRSQVVTSEIDSLFGGIYYHSYFKIDDIVVDVAANTLYREDTFDSFYKPKEILKVPILHLQECLDKLPEDNTNHCKVLRLAIQNKIKSES